MFNLLETLSVDILILIVFLFNFSQKCQPKFHLLENNSRGKTAPNTEFTSLDLCLFQATEKKKYIYIYIYLILPSLFTFQ
jgi:hypothetical protein